MRKQKVIVDELFSMSPTGTYWYSKGYNPAAVIATVVGAVVAMVPVLGKDSPGCTPQRSTAGSSVVGSDSPSITYSPRALPQLSGMFPLPTL